MHTTENKAAQLLKWIRKERQVVPDAAMVQRFCLVVGICLRDLSLIDSLRGSSDNVPAFLSRSRLDSDTRTDILQACADAFSQPSGDGVGGIGNGKGKGKGRASAAASSSLATTSTVAPMQEITEAARPRRSKRNAARQS